MQRYFVEDTAFQRDHVRFHGDELHHISRVMRYSPGDRVIACNGRGRSTLVEFTSITKEVAIAQIVEDIKEQRELPIEVTLAQGIAKGEKMDLIVQKATELGAYRIIPFSSARTIVKLNDKKESNRISRWQKIAKEAAEQSHRSIVPVISEVVTFKELLDHGISYDLCLIAYENESKQHLRTLLEQQSEGSKILVAIGPEGGFSENEVEQAISQGYYSISLGRRILRTETAGIVALSLIGYHFEA